MNQDSLQISRPASRKFEIAALLKRLEPHPVFFENETETHQRVVGNLFCDKHLLGRVFKTPASQLLTRLSDAIAHPTSPSVISQAP
ncbi:MAG: hypothetical protein ACPL1K_08130, partial [Candidatus Kryptoniota bacterium]